MSFVAPVTGGSAASSDFLAVGAASAQFPAINTMVAGQTFVFSSNTGCWILQGANPTAAASAGSMFVPAGVPIVIDGGIGAKLAVIRDSADGKCSLTKIRIAVVR